MFYLAKIADYWPAYQNTNNRNHRDRISWKCCLTWYTHTRMCAHVSARAHAHTLPHSHKFNMFLSTGGRKLKDTNMEQPVVAWCSYHISLTGVFPGCKAARAWSLPSPPCSAAVKNAWSYTYAPPVCLNDVARDNFTSYVLFNDISSSSDCTGVLISL
jgi:hypothetical protein